MLRHVLGLVAILLAVAWPGGARLAWAHGGRYSGPHGEVPPDSRTPQDPPPPDTGGNTPTPPDTGGGGTPTPPDQGGTPTPPPDGGTPDGGDGGGGETPPGPGTSGGGVKSGNRTPARKGPSYESWLFWWHANKEEFLAGRRSKFAPGSGASGLGELASSGEVVSEERDVTARTIESRVVPLLRRIAEDGRLNFDIQASGVLGLAKAGRREAVPLMMQMARNAGSDPRDQYHRVVQETAALSLGVLQERSPGVRKSLAELATDGAAPVRVRCFAAFALGLLGEPDAAAGADAESLSVLKALARSGEANRDITSSALTAIGLLGDRSAVPELLTWLREEKAGDNGLADLQLSCVAAALGRIGRPGLAGPDSREVVEALRDQLRRNNRMTRYSSIIALGQIAPNGDESVQKECVSYLSEIVRGEGKGKGTGDTQSVNFALVSLGRIAGTAPGADGRGGCPQAVRDRALGVLLGALDERHRGRSFAALGLGLAAGRLEERVRAPVAEIVLGAFTRTLGDDEHRAALAISLGLLREPQAVGPLLAVLGERREDRTLRGAAAVALGLIGDRRAVEAVRGALEQKEDRALRVDAAVAAGLLGDREAVRLLVETLRDIKSSQFVLGSAATALGRIGDERAVEPLAAILVDGDYQDLTRALACVALGNIADRGEVPVLSRVSKDVNYRAHFDALAELLTIL